DVAAAIGAHIDNQRFLVELRVVPLDEFADPVGAHIGNVNVTNAAISGFVDPLAVLVDPVEIDQIRFVGNGTIRDNARAFHRRPAVYGQRNGIVGLIAQQAINIIAAF